MSALSWGIYAAQVSGGVQAAMVAVGVVSAIFGVARGVVTAASINLRNTSRSFEDEAPALRPGAESARAPLVIAGCFFLASAFVPSSGTAYAILVSQVGEKALISETGGRALKAINAWMDKQIEGQ